MAWLWTALKADYRPTFPFQASVVLIQAQNAAASALPVLRRDLCVQPNLMGPWPTITEVIPPNGQPAAGPGDLVTVQGANLAGATAVQLSNSRLQVQQTVAPLSNVGNASFQFTVPDSSASSPPASSPPVPDLPVGIYLVSAQVNTGLDAVLTNGLPLAIAPRIDPSSVPATITAGSPVSLSVSCAPSVRVGQQVALLIGGQQAPADPFTAATNSPSFTFPTLAPTGQPVPVRLRVDGLDSPIVDLARTPPAFSGPTVQVVS
jgi:hypothetical protein